MSDYWKSTPKYWCDHCNVFVRDTKLERANHESTAKHQNNLSKFLRNIHKENEREEREKQRAKDEIARLNGTPASSGSISAVKVTAAGSATSGSGGTRQATAEGRKRQIDQLAAMGVAVPEQYRKDLAIAGDWQVVSRKPAVKTEPDTKSESKNPKVVADTIGIKRGMDESEVDQEEEPGRKRPAWGAAIKTYQDANSTDGDLDALLGSSAAITKRSRSAGSPKVKLETQPDALTGDEHPKETQIKIESAAEADVASELPDVTDVKSKPEPPDDGADVVFKKRKAKPKR